MSDIAVGDRIHHTALPPGLLDVTSQPCEGVGYPDDHPQYLIKDPETGESDWVCSRDFRKVQQ